jgi:very-short-patch-repair endonuclease
MGGRRPGGDPRRLRLGAPPASPGVVGLGTEAPRGVARFRAGRSRSSGGARAASGDLCTYVGAKSARRDPDAVAARIAARQHGVISVTQLRYAGLTRRAIGRRAAAGKLYRIYRGVYAVGHPGLSREGKWMAAVVACGEGAVLSHRSAAALWGFAPKPRGRWDELTPEVTVPGYAGRARRQGLRIHRSATLLPSQTTLRLAIPVTRPARTLADLRRTISAREWRAALREAEYLRLPLDGLFGSDRTRSETEARLLRLLRRHHLPLPEVNARLGAYTVDLLWRAERLVVEVDTYRSHGGRAMFDADRRRDAWLRRNGWQVVRVTDQWMEEAPAEVAATISGLLQRSGD